MNGVLVQREIDEQAVAALADIHPVLGRVYAARGISGPRELDLGLSQLLPFDTLKDIDRAAEIIAGVMAASGSIVIVGDFDADGATSCALGMRALDQLGATRVNYLVPNRFEYGYGLTPEIVELAGQFDPDLVITVDNGISSVAGVAAAKKTGCQVIITDHHLAGRQLPDADAIVNPNQPGCEFPGKSIAGVGVLFYLLMALRQRLREKGWFAQRKIPEPNLAQFLDLVALGTVADVVPLDLNNRILVHQGLARIRAGKCVPGISALLDVAGRNQRDIVAADMGFAVGPRLNAAGRLQDMSLGIRCLLADDRHTAQSLAIELNRLNQERRSIESEMKEQAMLSLQAIDVEHDQPGITLYDPKWHQGVVGIVASRIKEQFNRPVIAFANADDSGAELKGSARSIPGLHIRDLLDAIATAHPDLLQKFGGHAMAAGLTLARANFEAFAEAFNQQVKQTVNQDDLQARLYTDGALETTDFELELAAGLRNAGPWGQAFPEPLFEGLFTVIDQRVVGEKHLKLRLSPLSSELALDAIAFFVDIENWPLEVPFIRAAYKLDVNEFRGNRKLQLVIDYLEPLNHID